MLRLSVARSTNQAGWVLSVARQDHPGLARNRHGRTPRRDGGERGCVNVTARAPSTVPALRGASRPAEFAALTASQIRGGADATNRLLADRRVFAVEGPAARFPAFQVEDGEPRPVIARVPEALAGSLADWEILLWFTGSTGHLDGARPVDRLLDTPDEVVTAAAYQASLSED